MATRKKATTKKPEVVEASPLEAGWRAAGGSEEQGAASDDGFDKARVAFGQTEELVRLKVYQKRPDGVEVALETFDYDPDVHSEDFVRQRYGPGSYRLRFSDRSWRWIGSFTVHLGAIPGMRNPQAVADTSGANDGFDPLPYFMHEAEKTREQFNTMVLALLAKGEGGDGGSIAALIKSQGDQAARAEERNMVLLQKLIDRPAGGAGGVDTVMKALELGMNAVADVKVDSDGGWVSALRSVAKELGPVLSQLMAQKQVAGVVPPPGAPGGPQFPPGSVPSPPAQLAPPSPAQPNEVFRGLLTRYAPIALQVAKEGQPPVEFAGQLLDSIGVNFHPLFDSLQAHDLVSLQPELGSVMWKNPADGTDTRWIDEVVQLLHTRDWGLEDEAPVPNEGAVGS